MVSRQTRSDRFFVPLQPLRWDERVYIDLPFARLPAGLFRHSCSLPFDVGGIGVAGIGSSMARWAKPLQSGTGEQGGRGGRPLAHAMLLAIFWVGSISARIRGASAR